MKKSVMRKNLHQSIKNSLARYIAIIAIIALGAAMFVGLRTTKSDMIVTGQRYTDGQNMFDFRILNPYGWTKDDVIAIQKLKGIADAEGCFSMDVIARLGEQSEDSVYKVHAIPDKINKVYLLKGRMPNSPDECLADGFHASEDIIGKTFAISDANESATLDNIRVRTFTVVGYVSTPLYMDMSRGNTNLGNGSITGYVYVPMDSISADYFTEINVTIPGDYTIYTEKYNLAMDDMGGYIEEAVRPLSQNRLEKVKEEAEKAYQDGLSEYEEGLRAFTEAEEKARLELTLSKEKLEQGEKDLNVNRKLLEESDLTLLSGQKEIDKNRQDLAQAEAEAYKQISQANAELLKNYKDVLSAMDQIDDGLNQIDDARSQIQSGISQLQTGISQAQVFLAILDSSLSVSDYGIQQTEKAISLAEQQGAPEEDVEKLRRELNVLIEKRNEYVEQHNNLKKQISDYSDQLKQLQTQEKELLSKQNELLNTQDMLRDSMAAIEIGFMELQASQTQAQNEFSAAKAMLDSAQSQLNTAQKEAENGKKQLEAAQQELEAGWESFYKGRAEVLQKLGESKQELQNAKFELDAAKETIDGMNSAEVYVLDRNTNMGYVALDNNSDIVEGVSAVFPAFFLLIAALVCITTMTRMVEEERTQIGTLKALGFLNWEIMRKYLIYAGSAAVVGCALGTVIGSAVFPLILWKAYGIILLLTPSIVLQMDVPLCLGVVLAYTIVTLLVTWYCCKKALEEVPAELIRPKAPTIGKKIFLEYLPFWDKLSFLNKVMLRNIFRYRQRLLMMLVGIGGCTALLLTGFGLRDSIVEIVHKQFEEITLYDLDVRFSQDQSSSQQELFIESLKDDAEDILFYHQSSMELEYNDSSADITFICADNQVKKFIDFHSGKLKLSVPNEGDALISIGVAENLGIKVGDTVTLRNHDLKTLKLTVSGIYDNHVNNFIITCPDSVKAQWGAHPSNQSAAVILYDTADIHEVSAGIMDMNDVMNVSVNADIAEQVSGMLKALDMIVITVVICAGLLAVIVVYNLTNINITERIREIATIKVLGFNAKESAMYVFKENMFLSVMGSAVGLVGGVFLLEFVMSQIQVSFVWMPAKALPLTFVFSVILTILSAVLVDIVLYFKLEKVNMAEALKSVE